MTFTFAGACLTSGQLLSNWLRCAHAA